MGDDGMHINIQTVKFDTITKGKEEEYFRSFGKWTN